jgi:hypothetical protein
MTDKLTPQQQTQLAILETLPPKFEVVNRIIGEIETLHADDAQIRRLCRLLDTGKSAANSIGQTALADTMGIMTTIARRGGDVRMKVRGLRDGLASLKTNYEGAVRAVHLLSRAGPPPPTSASAPATDPPADPKSAPPSR